MFIMEMMLTAALGFSHDTKLEEMHIGKKEKGTVNEAYIGIVRIKPQMIHELVDICCWHGGILQAPQLAPNAMC